MSSQSPIYGEVGISPALNKKEFFELAIGSQITKEGIESPMCFINYINCLALKIKYLIPPWSIVTYKYSGWTTCLLFPFFEIGVCTFFYKQPPYKQLALDAF